MVSNETKQQAEARGVIRERKPGPKWANVEKTSLVEVVDALCVEHTPLSTGPTNEDEIQQVSEKKYNIFKKATVEIMGGDAIDQDAGNHLVGDCKLRYREAKGMPQPKGKPQVRAKPINVSVDLLGAGVAELHGLCPTMMSVEEMHKLTVENRFGEWRALPSGNQVPMHTITAQKSHRSHRFNPDQTLPTLSPGEDGSTEAFDLFDLFNLGAVPAGVMALKAEIIALGDYMKGIGHSADGEVGGRAGHGDMDGTGDAGVGGGIDWDLALDIKYEVNADGTISVMDTMEVAEEARAAAVAAEAAPAAGAAAAEATPTAGAAAAEATPAAGATREDLPEGVLSLSVKMKGVHKLLQSPFAERVYDGDTGNQLNSLLGWEQPETVAQLVEHAKTDKCYIGHVVVLKPPDGKDFRVRLRHWPTMFKYHFIYLVNLGAVRDTGTAVDVNLDILSWTDGSSIDKAQTMKQAVQYMFDDAVFYDEFQSTVTQPLLVACSTECKEDTSRCNLFKALEALNLQVTREPFVINGSELGMSEGTTFTVTLSYKGQLGDTHNMQDAGGNKKSGGDRWSFADCNVKDFYDVEKGIAPPWELRRPP